ncbi:MAG: hypothetical protein R2932_25365 [Caldilineaceae bacterium]
MTAIREQFVAKIQVIATLPWPATAPKPEVIAWALHQAPKIAAVVEEAKATIHSDAFFDGPVGLNAFKTVVDALEIALAPISQQICISKATKRQGRWIAVAPCLSWHTDAETNIFLDYFRKGIIKDIARERPDVVGISIPPCPRCWPG